MYQVQSIILRWQDRPTEDSEFRNQFLVPLCGQEKAQLILTNIKYRLYVACASVVARKTLAQVESDGTWSLEYREGGIWAKFHCVFFDGRCTANMVYCKKDNHYHN